jgi:hypothetical protein
MIDDAALALLYLTLHDLSFLTGPVPINPA